jgi:DNA-3-methyladenine glycosylase II
VKELVSGNGRMMPQGVLVRTDADLRGAGLSRRKAEYLRDLAEKTETGDIDFARLAALSDDDVIRQLSVVRGVGVWTAQMFLMFALRRPDVLPAGDLGIRSAIRRAYRLRALPKPAKIERLARKWHPYCSAASWYLWRSSDDVLL